MSDYHKKYNEFYNSKNWQNLRNYKFAQANGLCEKCLKEGKVIQGKEIHHILHIDKCWAKRLDLENLICLCRECHDKQHERASAWSNFKDFWEELNVKDAENNPR